VTDDDSLYDSDRKERETYEHRLTGKQIFARKRAGGSMEDGDEDEEDAADLVDISQYDREDRVDEEEEKDQGVLLADSDSD
jgi:hypothetical protein